LGTLGGQSGVALSINNNGDIVGQSDTTTYGSSHATLWNNGSVTDLGALPFGANSTANSINNKGQIVGSSNLYASTTRTHATSWNNGALTDLGTLGGMNSQALSINDLSQIVGFSDTPNNVAQHATLWSDNTIIDLGTLGGIDSFAYDINMASQIVGWSNIPGSDAQHATLWQNGLITDLNSVVTLPNGLYLTVAFGINDLNEIIASGSNEHAYLLNIDNVPLPGSVWLLGTSLLGIALISKRKPT
jgi:probable HAF family extracellular repeat protein